MSISPIEERLRIAIGNTDGLFNAEGFKKEEPEIETAVYFVNFQQLVEYARENNIEKIKRC